MVKQGSESPPPRNASGKVAGLPIISITPYLLDETSRVDIQERRAATSSALHRACRDFGFFYLDISAFADPREPDELAKLGRAFFSLPQEEKDKLGLKNEDYARGYQRLRENVTNGLADNHEGIDFYRPVKNPDKSKPLWGSNQWPTVPGFREKYEAWTDKMQTLGMIVMEAMAIGLGMSQDEWKALSGQVDNSFWVMRVIGYPPLPNDHAGFSCGAHKDYGCLTFLYADPTPNALQVFVPRSMPGAAADLTDLPAEQGNERGIWITADPIPGCVVCNIGEMWEIWSNGLYKSTLHRVVHRGNNYRVSIPFFFEPNFDAKIAPLPAALRIIKSEKKEAHNKDELKMREPVVYGEFLQAKVGNNFTNGNGKYGN